jgi:hypothetical protein
MAYVRNPVYLGVGAVDQVDRNAGVVRQSKFQDQYKRAFLSVARMSPQAMRAFAQELMDAVSTLPQAQRAQIESLTKEATKNVDPRAPRGLGLPAELATAANAVHWTTQVANIAGVVASLATVGFGVATFIDQRKSSKKEQERQDKAQAMAKKQMDADLAERQGRLAEAKAQTASIQAQQAEEARLKQLNDSGYTVAPDGSVVPKPKNTALTAGAVGAAVVGAFLMSK